MKMFERIIIVLYTAKRKAQRVRRQAQAVSCGSQVAKCFWIWFNDDFGWSKNSRTCKLKLTDIFFDRFWLYESRQKNELEKM